MHKRVAVVLFISVFLVGFLSFGVTWSHGQESEANIPEDEVQEVVQPAEPQQPAEPPKPLAQPLVQPNPQEPSEGEQPAPPPQPEVHEPAPPPAPKPQPAPPQPAAKRGEVSFNFDDADVFSVIQTIFGDILRVNYIVDPAVKGRVNFRSVSPIAKEDVLPLMEVILRLNGIAVVEEGGLYRIIPLTDIAREPAPVGVGRKPDEVMLTGTSLVQVVPVHFVQSSEMVRVLTPFLSKNAVIVDVPKSNYIIIVDTDSNVKRLLQLVAIFDSEQLKQITPKVFVYPVQNSKAKDVAALLKEIFLGEKPKSEVPKTTVTQPTPPAVPGQPPQPVRELPRISLGEMGGEAVVSENTRIIPDEVTNSIIILATPEDYKIIAETIQLIDITPRQVMIEAIVASVSLNDKMNFGLQWLVQNDLKISGLKPFEKDFDLSGTLNFTSLIGGPTLTYTALDAAGNVKLLIQALAQQDKAKILSAPHLLVSDNREARIQVGDQIPIATSTTTTPLASGTAVSNTTTSTIQYKDTGTILKVKPQVNDSGLISLELTQEVSRGSEVSVLGTTQFKIQKREVTTNLVAQDGSTIVIGGLIDESSSKSRSGIPFLSKIPILGYLFGSTTDTVERTELIILLTPYVVRNQKEAADTSSNYLDRFKKNTKMKEKELIPGKKDVSK